MADPYQLDLPVVVGNVAQTFANLVALRLDILNNPRPSYNLHGEVYDWPKMYDFINRQITDLQKQLSQLAPFEIVSAGR
jgi:hypothetical protein